MIRTLPATSDRRHQTADRVFRGALAANGALTVLWLFAVLTQRSIPFFGEYNVTAESFGRVAGGVLFFYVGWGFI